MMSTPYHAQVTDGIVTDIRRVSKEHMDQYPDWYPGLWVPVTDMSNYPALGWSWSEETGFVEPAPEISE